MPCRKRAAFHDYVMHAMSSQVSSPGLARLAEASGDRRGRLAHRLGTLPGHLPGLRYDPEPTHRDDHNVPAVILDQDGDQ
jgi:hypothetical protein